ncbi:MAG: 4Fe-4S dicluster domain-containing protein [Leptospirales bacterium]
MEGPFYTLTLQNVQEILDDLSKQGYNIIAAQNKNGAMVLDELPEKESPPTGYYEKQSPGKYELFSNGDKSLFKCSVPMQSWRKYLSPAEEVLFKTKIEEGSFEIEPRKEKTEKTVFFGIRACDLRGIEIQDRIFLKDEYIDPYYKKRRENLFIIAADCLHPAETCFCTSFDSGPSVKEYFDIALTEVEPGSFLARGNSQASQQYLHGFGEAGENTIASARAKVQEAANKITRKLDLTQAQKVLASGYDHGNWESIAQRCLSCTSCTLVCPTCFCSTVNESPSIDGKFSERVRSWDSCFNLSHSYIHGGHIRSSVKSRYRQWLTHKLLHQEEQFKTSGCTGCGRCLTWCPAAIDFTEEIPVFAKAEADNGVA